MLAAGRLRRFVEGLPGSATWTLWLKFAVIQTGNYKTFMQQCLENTTSVAQLRRRRPGEQTAPPGPKTPLTLALGWDRAARLHHWVSTSLCLFFLIKYRLLSLMGNQPTFLDCLVLGRFRFVGRTNKISGEIVSVFLFTFLVYRTIIHFCIPKFKFYALEFVMCELKQIVQKELEENNHTSAALRVETRPGSANTAPSCGRARDQGLRARGAAMKSLGQLVHREHRAPGEGPRRASCIDSVIYLRSPFGVDQGDQKVRWIRRPNRTAKSWLQLNLCTKILVYWSAYCLACWALLMYYVLAGSVLTNLGFEMAYPACVAWLRDTQARPGAGANVSFSDIYLAPRVLAHEIRIDDIPARIPVNSQDLRRANWYTLARISSDILENHLIYLECITLFAAQFYIIILHSIDVVLNASEIKVRLASLLDRLDERLRSHNQEELKRDFYSGFIGPTQRQLSERASANFAESQPWAIPRYLGASWHVTPVWMCARGDRLDGGQTSHLSARVRVGLDTRLTDDQLREEISDLQAILADHFQTITRGYNLFISFTLAIMGLCWVSYTVVVCVWMRSTRSQAIEFEFAFAETSVTLFCLVLTSGAALVRSRNLQLYQLVTRAMALDPDWSLTKPRWISILRYFYPKPYHCFTVFGSTEISVLLGLKLISWILSAFIVLANFFYTNRF